MKVVYQKPFGALISSTLLLGLLLFAPGCADRTAESAAADVEAQAAIAALDAVRVLDVRTPAEFAAGHIPGAINIDINGADFAHAVAALSRDEVYLVHCAANVPSGRSAKALDVMQQLGFERLQNLSGGIDAWQRAGGAIAGE
ncbi:MAG: rhodanese-like domain-containing protein [Pseudomonadota bacterium]